MLSYTFENSNTPMYEQLYTFIKDDIISGELPADTKLPSKRNLADQLSVSVITVENAYSQLLSEGFIYSLPRKGFYVSEIFSEQGYFDNYISGTDSSASLKNEKSKSSTSRSFPSDNTDKISVDLETDNGTCIDFSSNASDPATFPFATWANLTRRILSEDRDYLMKNSPSNGLPELRSAIAAHLRAYRGIVTDPENIIIGAGTETMYSILINLLGHDLTYATENPGYEKLHMILDANEVKNVRIGLDESGIIPSLLETNQVDIIHVTPSHHFPTGITMPIRRRYELLSWAALPGRYIIEDDYDSEFRLSGRPVPALYSIENSGNVIYMNTFTKSLASTIRISYMILPDTLARKYRDSLAFYSCTVSTFEQLTLARFISEGHYEKHINRMRTASRKKRDLLLKAIKESPLGSISEIREEQSGLHFILKLCLDTSDESFVEKCKKQGINISPVSESSFMINYSSIPIERIEEAVNRLNICI